MAVAVQCEVTGYISTYVTVQHKILSPQEGIHVCSEIVCSYATVLPYLGAWN